MVLKINIMVLKINIMVLKKTIDPFFMRLTSSQPEDAFFLFFLEFLASYKKKM